MKRYRQTLDELLQHLSPVGSSWRDAHADVVIQRLERLPAKSVYSRDDLLRLFDLATIDRERFDASLTVVRLFLDLSKDEFTAAMRDRLGRLRHPGQKRSGHPHRGQGLRRHRQQADRRSWRHQPHRRTEAPRHPLSPGDRRHYLAGADQRSGQTGGVAERRQDHTYLYPVDGGAVGGGFAGVEARARDMRPVQRRRKFGLPEFDRSAPQRGRSAQAGLPRWRCGGLRSAEGRIACARLYRLA